MISDVFKFIQADEPMPLDLMVRLHNWAHSSVNSDKRREVANSILPEAGDCLPFYLIDRFICAEISEEEAINIISQRKTYFRRACNLLPTIFRLLTIREEGDLLSAFLQIDDCCDAIPLMRKAGHRNRELKVARENILDLRQKVDELIYAMDLAKAHVSYEYEAHRESVLHIIRNNDKSYRCYDELRHSLMHLMFVSDLTLYRDKSGNQPLMVADGSPKSYVVKVAYRMSLQFDRPEFVTTPGSDFAALCGLIFELSTSDAESSFAGAIGRFARNDLRKELDEHERELRRESSSEWQVEVEADNFRGIRADRKRLSKEIAFWESFGTSRNFDPFMQEQISLRKADALEKLMETAQKHGPFLVWASHYSEQDQRQWRDDLKRSDASLLELQIAIGEIRRSRRS
ncbi:hypothetical protein [Methylocystis sp. JR02]|uniref:hypothetical protein n=1 Tax=Methylocystis sp. JR02 TaxID=3046284 RepID=UPI0024BB62BF|nr:hypothetical protein [Methylocystis sp. JR02]MDJ0449752.1 hypothetical protein [Methylocystis sp. JR02]